MRKKLITLFLISISIMVQSQTEVSKLIRPPALKKGDTIAIVAPAGILKNRKHVIDKAKKLAQSWGLKVVYGKNMFNQNHHFAGTDEERCQDFQDALDNPNIKAIWSARGGYGSVRILDLLDFTKFIENPKWIIGYSDITAFHNHIHNLGVETLHAMMGTSMQDKPEDIPNTIATFKKALFGETLNYKISSSKYNKEAAVQGQLIGGNIAILASMLGSDSQISTEGKVLFIEEIGEYKYSIDRMLQSLKRAGYFTKVKAVVVGDMTKVKKNTTPWGSSIEKLILEVVPKDVPIVFNFPAGHEPDNRALIMGRNVRVTIKKVGTSELSFE
ncbi:muramoyltetrapeptide carboxypeptidase [Tenacibaculum sp. MAR_2009_124]|uniref:S66 peptidase family protein n=1 Tax=Tenacibaculum sp. MAR_2009_124 TaxID=1250059 RepID=UPI000896D0D2|nr:LD-carboxypeptidase [Tenacibaculum sp. MAR_2009_124]SEB99322.1 muramoyltetrapeptide carboxypeptidase [Tenacibaculum sp. MAR_2009_124]